MVPFKGINLCSRGFPASPQSNHKYKRTHARTHARTHKHAHVLARARVASLIKALKQALPLIASRARILTVGDSIQKSN